MSRSNKKAPPATSKEHGTPQSTPAAAPDPFDPARLRLSQDFGATLGVKKALLTVPHGKPHMSWFVQVHPDETYHLQTAVIELKVDRETYLVDQALWSELGSEATFGPRAIFTSITRQGVVFLWIVRLPGQDGKLDQWSQSALEAAKMATGKWCRVVANMHLGAYEVFEAASELGAPTWPDLPMSALLRISFKGFYIDTLDHPVLRKLRGEV